MSDYKSIKTEELTKIANAIRYKTGKNDKISLEAMAEKIREIEGGVSLPELENEGSASDLLSGKELIDDEGNVVTGTFTIDNELEVQDDLIAQIQIALEGKAGGGSGGEDLTAVLNQQAEIITQLETALENATVGGGGGSVETCTVAVSIDSNFQMYEIYYTSVVDGKLTALYEPIGRSGCTVTLNNVAVGSALCVGYSDGSGMSLATITGGRELRKFIYNVAFLCVSIDSADGVTVDIGVTSDNPYD